MASFKDASIKAPNPHNFSWQQTMLRIKDPEKTVPFYRDNFGFSLIHQFNFPQWEFSLYFMAILPEGEVPPTPGTPEAEKYLWNFKGVTLELTHNHGSEKDDKFEVNNGNVEPHRGFGHIAVMTKDVYAASTELEANGVAFKKRPDEGRMKGLAFCLDPDGYWIEIIKRAEDSPINNKYTFAQTMLRVKDPEKSVKFYREMFGMTLLRSSDMSDFSLYFLADNHVDPGNSMGQIFEPVLELTHNHGTESDPDFSYHNGNDQDKGQVRGFGHIGFLCDDLDAACAYLEEKGAKFKKKPQEGTMRGLAFVYDPDGYWVEIIDRKLNSPN